MKHEFARTDEGSLVQVGSASFFYVLRVLHAWYFANFLVPSMFLRCVVHRIVDPFDVFFFTFFLI